MMMMMMQVLPLCVDAAAPTTFRHGRSHSLLPTKLSASAWKASLRLVRSLWMPLMASRRNSSFCQTARRQQAVQSTASHRQAARRGHTHATTERHEPSHSSTAPCNMRNPPLEGAASRPYSRLAYQSTCGVGRRARGTREGGMGSALQRAACRPQRQGRGLGIHRATAQGAARRPGIPPPHTPTLTSGSGRRPACARSRCRNPA